MSQRGMTLVELMIVVVVASIIGIAMLNLFITSNRTFMDQNKILDAQRDGRLVMEFITRTLREAGLNPKQSRDPGSGNLIAGVEEATSTKIRISRDSDMSGTIETNKLEQVSFEYDVARRILKRGFDETTAAVWTDMVKNVDQFVLTYFDEDGVDIGDPDTALKRASIRSIELTIRFQDTKYVGGDFTRSYKTRVLLRNL